MPKSSAPRKSAKSKPILREVLERAASVDRRRRAQIENQKLAIDRLLEAMNDNAPVDQAIRREMTVLREGAAELKAQRDEALEALKELVGVVGRISATGELPHELDDALSDAQTLLGAVTG